MLDVPYGSEAVGGVIEAISIRDPPTASCNDKVGEGEKCSGSQQLATIRRLSPSEAVTRKIFYENTRRVMKIR